MITLAATLVYPTVDSGITITYTATAIHENLWGKKINMAKSDVVAQFAEAAAKSVTIYSRYCSQR